MIEINLLPKELRKTQLAKNINFSQYAVIPIFLLAAAIILNLILGLILVVNRTQLASSRKHWDALYPDYKPVEEIKEKLQSVNRQVGNFNNIFDSRISWAKKLNTLSDKISDGVWFKRLKIEKDGLIKIDGSVASQSEGEVAVLNKYIASLKQDESFFKDFKDVEIKSLLKHNIAEAEVTDFTLVFHKK